MPDNISRLQRDAADNYDDTGHMMAVLHNLLEQIPDDGLPSTEAAKEHIEQAIAELDTTRSFHHAMSKD